MKKIWFIIALFTAPFFAAYSQNNDNNSDDIYYSGPDNSSQPSTDQDNYDEQDNTGGPTYQTFYDELSPYGTWINDPTYGYVWLPNNVDPDFSPYLTGGHWVYTEYGWTWVSDYDWGWGPFHYGRWYFDDFRGWMWMPGYDWAPAWVVWGDYGGYYCWAPVGPREVLGPHYRPNPHHWYFVQHEHIGREHVRNYIVSHDVAIHNDYTHINDHINIVNHAGTYNQGVFYAGPKPNEVEKYTGQKVDVLNVKTVNKAEVTKVNGDRVNIYRPDIARTGNQHAAPGKVAVQQPNPGKVNVQQPDNNRIPVQQQNPVPQRNVNPERQPTRQDWTPPRQNTPRQNPPVQQQQPQRIPVQPQRSEPMQQQRPDRGFVPQQRQEPMQQQRPMQMQQQRAPQPMQQMRQPSVAPRGGGGGRH